jgi:hypothetical protein
MTESMVERVAERIRQCGIDRGHPVHQVVAQHLAAAAIEAMREPTQAMRDEFYLRNYGDADEVWQSMIDEALN